MAFLDLKKLKENHLVKKEAKRHTILIVDDEEINLQGLRGLLSPKYYLLEARNGQEALETIQIEKREGREIHLIITDQRMPKMMGVQFLEKSLQIMPNTKRIILSGFSDMDAVVDSINKAKIYKFMFKPFERNDMLVTIKRALEVYDLRKKNDLLMETFKKFVPKQFLERIAVEGVENIELGKAKKELLTILFADIRSFTRFSETLSPQDLFKFINAYLERMNRPIHENHGFIDKFRGDGIMALFGQPNEKSHPVDLSNGKNDLVNLSSGKTEKQDHDEDYEQQVQNAIQAAIAMQRKLQEYNEDRAAKGKTLIETGIGVHSGEVIIGTIGSKDRMDSTVLGDNVNLAARLEELTQYYGAKIIITVDTLRLLERPALFKFRELDWLRVKGRKQPIQLYEIFDCDPLAIQKLKKKSQSHLKYGLYLRHSRRWEEALKAFQTALDIYPEDKAVQLQIEHCKKLRELDLPDHWDGAVELYQDKVSLYVKP